ncbi:MAG TPA: ATPase domain-containing protein [Dehalococcoidales bacterium]|nr:ATPase domain-containing protein [Dehalococcoidales bacterium]
MDNNENKEAKKEIISTGHPEIDKKLGGGLPIGSLTLIEGQSDAGKSVLCQQMIWGSLKTENKIIVFTAENSTKSLIKQMDSLGLFILDYVLLNRIKIYYMKASEIKKDASKTLDTILDTIGKNSNFRLIIVDSLTPIVSSANDNELLGYFERCKSFCDQKRTIINVLHTYAVNNDILIRLRSACDAHLKLTIEKIGDKLVKTLEVAKVRGAAQTTGNIVTFEVEPEVGMKIMPLSRAKA